MSAQKKPNKHHWFETWFLQNPRKNKFIANMSDEEICAELREFDIDGDGFVKKEDLKKWFLNNHCEHFHDFSEFGAEFIEMMEKHGNGDGQMNYVKSVKKGKKLEKLKELDLNGDGFVTKRDIINYIQKEYMKVVEQKFEPVLDKYIKEADKNENGQIDYVKFVRTFKELEFGHHDPKQYNGIAGMRGEEICAELRKFDINGDGFVKKDDLKNCFLKHFYNIYLENGGTESNLIDEVMKNVFKNGESEINYGQLNKLVKEEKNVETEHLETLENLKEIDLNGDGIVTKEEMISYIWKDFNEEFEPILDEQIKEADKNENGQIDYVKFVQEFDINEPDFKKRDSEDDSSDEESDLINRLFGDVSLKDEMKRKKAHEERVALFKKYDLNGDGFIDKEEVKKLMSEERSDVTDTLVKQVIRHYKLDFYGDDRDGKISFDEFTNGWHESCKDWKERPE